MTTQTKRSLLIGVLLFFALSAYAFATHRRGDLGGALVGAAIGGAIGAAIGLAELWAGRRSRRGQD